jgi:trimeric autotransporter adhesin
MLRSNASSGRGKEGGVRIYAGVAALRDQQNWIASQPKFNNPTSTKKIMKIKNMTTLHLRNPISRSPWRGGFLLLPLVLACFALLPGAQAVTPAPDGGYPGNNTAEGTNALFSRTTGAWDSAFGDSALFHDTTGTANTALGRNAMFSNIDGNGNTGNGTFTLFSNTHGDGNTALGNSALFKNLTGNSNTAMGANALHENTAGSANIAVGQGALANNTASNNVAVGFQALISATSSPENVAVGFHALAATSGSNGFNVAVGFQALDSVTTGGQNTGVGDNALNGITTGTLNTALGDLAGVGHSTSDSNNIDIGAFTFGVAGQSNTVRIGGNLGNTVGSSQCFIGGIAGTFQLANNANIRPVTVNRTTGLLGFGGTNPVDLGFESSRRFKDEIKPLDKASEVIYALKPVTFRYKADHDATRTLRSGLIAEEVEKVNRDLVMRDEEGKPAGVFYNSINMMLLNEFLKEHQTVKDLKSTVAKQEKQIEALTAGLQKVSAQVHMSKPASQTVANNQ